MGAAASGPEPGGGALRGAPAPAQQPRPAPRPAPRTSQLQEALAASLRAQRNGPAAQRGEGDGEHDAAPPLGVSTPVRLLPRLPLSPPPPERSRARVPRAGDIGDAAVGARPARAARPPRRAHPLAARRRGVAPVAAALRAGGVRRLVAAAAGEVRTTAAARRVADSAAGRAQPRRPGGRRSAARGVSDGGRALALEPRATTREAPAGLLRCLRLRDAAACAARRRRVLRVPCVRRRATALAADARRPRPAAALTAAR